MKKYAHKVVNNIKHAFKKKPLLIKTIFILVTIIALNLSLLFVVRTKTVENALKRLLVAVDVYTNAVEKVEMNSDGWKDNKPGSWHIEKSAHWTGVDTAEVDITLDTKEKLDISNTHVIRDLILVIDSSLSMENDSKLDVVKEQAKKLVDAYLFDEKNHMALIEFNDEAESLQYFTKDKETLKSSIDEINPVGNTNYNDALKKVGETLARYDIDTDMERPYKSVLVLFLTDGVPCVDTPNEVATYAKLKSTYSYIHIKGIQYEMGEKITPYLERITDSQNIATKETLGQIFFGATIVTERYKSFVITDYIKSKYFYIKSKEDIEVGRGTVELLEEDDGSQRVVWDLGTDLMTGLGYWETGSNDLEIKIGLTLKDEYADDNEKDFYPTNSKVTVSSQLPNEDILNKEDEITPVLKRIYDVIYDTNPPESCKNLKEVKKESHYALGTVTKKQEQLVCQDYLFKGWEIVEDDVRRKSEDVFVMPTHDVNVRGVWANMAISKDFDGKIVKKIDLYDQVRYDAEIGAIGAIYTGTVSDKYNETLEKFPTYHYITDSKNSIVFGGFCWQMLRTTATGGVKVIYNGKYTEENRCNNSDEDAFAIIPNSDDNKISFNDSNKSLSYAGYMYNDETIYESTVLKATEILDTTLFGNTVEWNGTHYTLSNTHTGIDENHHYTCKNTSEQCDSVYYFYYSDDGRYSSIEYRYITLTGGDKVEQALVKMLSADDVNKKDSTLKAAIDSWYVTNLSSYSDYIEDTVYCNERSYNRLGGWNPNGGKLNSNSYLDFGNYIGRLSCPNETDRFSVANPKAKLTYPIGTITDSESDLVENAYSESDNFWSMSPHAFAWDRNYLTFNAVRKKGNNVSWTKRNIRPVISLKSGTKYKNGTGTLFDPYIIDTTE